MTPWLGYIHFLRCAQRLVHARAAWLMAVYDVDDSVAANLGWKVEVLGIPISVGNAAMMTNLTGIGVDLVDPPLKLARVDWV
ncbi:MAG: hypothetical protein ACO34E_03435 [Limisphaerales bacterium]